MNFRSLWAIVTLVILAKKNPIRCEDLLDKPNSTLDKLLDVVISRIIGQKSQDSSVTPKYYKSFLLNDNTNEDIATYSAQEILARSGYQYENHFVASDDGYITNLIRIVNPLADRAKLKQPPVMMMHGGITDFSLWIWSSAIQHHPEKYPRVAADGPITSWNKSLGFVLANNGYDVWLVGTRGSNIQNKRHVKLTKHYNWFDQIELAKLGPAQEAFSRDVHFELDYRENFQYWNFTMDDIGAFEVPRQQQKILQVTGSNNVTLVDVSFSTQINWALMSENAQFLSKLHNYINVEPILNNRGTNLAISTFHATLCTRVPLPLGILLSQVVLSPVLRSIVSTVNIFKELRYSLIKQLFRIIAGPSAQYETNLDSGVVGRIFSATGYKQIRHYCQQVLASQLQKYDYGLAENSRIYGSPLAPKYDLSNIELPNWLLVSAGNDKLATSSSVKQLLSSVRRQPNKHIHIERYNHLDIYAAVESDLLVNLPVLNFLDQFAVAPPKETSIGRISGQ